MSIQRLPAWRNVEDAILSGTYTYGDLIPYGELFAMLGMPKPELSDRADAMESWRLSVLQERASLVEHMLKQHAMMLETENGVGIRILLPSEQTGAAERTLRKELTRSLRAHRDRISNVAYDRLTPAQQKENTDAQVRIAQRVDALRAIEHSRLIAKPK
ncbi:hypothetical protein FHW12_000366 [Dokdonella fugitiva]|uniref:Uncharacterized protein n=1 Tax=Dokdonella fugitiva TaxID=328517 RepID=A0A839EQZ5_9GAMM|nr:hypothetical protein [Dokdonella fugitiva]MBA8886175.1 hypothetical protein [Dokdonella fugitiva]